MEICTLIITSMLCSAIQLKNNHKKLVSVINDKGKAISFKQTNDEIELQLDKNETDYLRVYKMLFSN